MPPKSSGPGGGSRLIAVLAHRSWGRIAPGIGTPNSSSIIGKDAPGLSWVRPPTSSIMTGIEDADKRSADNSCRPDILLASSPPAAYHSGILEDAPETPLFPKEPDHEPIV